MDMDIRQMVGIFGGDTKLGALLGLAQPTVASWKLRNRLPPTRYLQLQALAEAHGIGRLPDSLFAWDGPIPAAAKRKRRRA